MLSISDFVTCCLLQPSRPGFRGAYAPQTSAPIYQPTAPPTGGMYPPAPRAPGIPPKNIRIMTPEVIIIVTIYSVLIFIFRFKTVRSFSCKLYVDFNCQSLLLSLNVESCLSVYTFHMLHVILIEL